MASTQSPPFEQPESSTSNSGVSGAVLHPVTSSRIDQPGWVPDFPKLVAFNTLDVGRNATIGARSPSLSPLSRAVILADDNSLAAAGALSLDGSAGTSLVVANRDSSSSAPASIPVDELFPAVDSPSRSLETSTSCRSSRDAARLSLQVIMDDLNRIHNGIWYTLSFYFSVHAIVMYIRQLFSLARGLQGLINNLEFLLQERIDSIDADDLQAGARCEKLVAGVSPAVDALIHRAREILDDWQFPEYIDKRKAAGALEMLGSVPECMGDRKQEIDKHKLMNKRAEKVKLILSELHRLTALEEMEVSFAAGTVRNALARSRVWVSPRSWMRKRIAPIKLCQAMKRRQKEDETIIWEELVDAARCRELVRTLSQS